LSYRECSARSKHAQTAVDGSILEKKRLKAAVNSDTDGNCSLVDDLWVALPGTPPRLALEKPKAYKQRGFNYKLRQP
jgi:hypothetical protein